MSDRKSLTYEDAEKIALQAIHDDDGRGMIGRNRRHLHQRVARAILAADKASLAERDRLRDALRNLVQAADHVGSRIYDWQRMLPQYADEARAALGDKP